MGEGGEQVDRRDCQKERREAGKAEVASMRWSIFSCSMHSPNEIAMNTVV